MTLPPFHTKDIKPKEHYAVHTTDRWDKIHLFCKSTSLEHWRYELTIVDTPITSSKIPCAIFLIPGGREHEFLFSTKEGLYSIADSANCVRLIAVALSRYHEYPDDASLIQNELSSQSMKRDEYLLPILASFRHVISSSSDKIPFMSIAGIGKREVLVEGEGSESTGPYVVEECETTINFPPEIVQVRRLYFKRTPHLIQSEAVLLSKSESDDVISVGGEIDHMRMPFEHNWYICAGILLSDVNIIQSDVPLSSDNVDYHSKEALVVGLGGGGLLNFLARFQPDIKFTVVELDVEIVNIAKAYFGFEENDHMKVCVGDGLDICCHSESVEKSNAITFAAGSLHAIIFDVDSKDSTVGMSCPPLSFIDITYLQNIAMLLAEDGVLVINVSARKSKMLDLVVENLYKVFGTVLIGSDNNEEEDKSKDCALNVVLLAMKDSGYKLPGRMDLVDRLHNFCDSVSITDTRVRGQLEDCLISTRIFNKNKSEIVIDKAAKTSKAKKRGKKKKRK